MLPAAIFTAVMISIHALREESDRAVRQRVHARIFISIHALREESDPAGR